MERSENDPAANTAAAATCRSGWPRSLTKSTSLKPFLSALRYGYGMIAYAYDHATPRAASPGRFHHASGRRRHGPTHTGRAHRLGSWRIPACAGQLQRSDRPTIALSGQVYRSELTRFRSRPRHPMPLPYGRGQPSVRARPDRCTEDRGPRVGSARPSSACHNVSGVPPHRRGPAASPPTISEAPDLAVSATYQDQIRSPKYTGVFAA